MTNPAHRYNPYPNQGRFPTKPDAKWRTKTSMPLPDVSMRRRPHSNGSNFSRDRFGQRNLRTQPTNPHVTRHFPPNLTPIPSPLRPDCPAKDRLCLWIPTTPPHAEHSANPPLSIMDENRIREVLVEAYSDTTKATYGTGLLVFHVFCDKKGIEESQRTPCGQSLLSSFIATLIRDYSAPAIENYTYGLCTVAHQNGLTTFWVKSLSL